MYLLNLCTFSLNIKICSFSSSVRSMEFGTDLVMCAKNHIFWDCNNYNEE